MPPFGNLFDMKVYLSKELSEEKEIVFNAGTHNYLNYRTKIMKN